MDIYKGHKRRIHIEGQLDDTRGYMLTVRDAQTGENINNITHIELSLGVDHENWATITYREKDAQGKLVVGKDRQPVEAEVVVDNPELSNVTAYVQQ